MNILMSADCFYPAQLGGPSSAIYWQAKALTQAGHRVTVVATSHALPPDIPLEQWLSMDCGRVIYTKNPHFYFPIKHVWYGWKAIRNADIVHVNSLFYPASVGWVLLSRLAKKPVVWSPHGELSPVALGFRPRLKQVLLKLFRRLSALIWFQATCKAEAAYVRHHFGPHTHVGEIRNLMELPVTIAPTRPDSTAPRYLLFIGRLHPIKAIDQLIEALSASTLFRNSTINLLIVGPVSDKQYAQQLHQQVQTLNLAAKISFREAVHGNEKEQMYANAFLTILPSHSENFGNVVIESLAQGTPVIASTGTPWQLLETERAGSWVNNDPDSIRAAIETYLSMPENVYQPYRKRAAALARRDYDVVANVGLWEHFYKQVMTAHNV